MDMYPNYQLSVIEGHAGLKALGRTGIESRLHISINDLQNSARSRQANLLIIGPVFLALTAPDLTELTH